MGYVDSSHAVETVPRDWTRIGLYLVAGTMAYNILEAVVGILAGVAAESIALLGFGFDSLIETAAAALLLFRLAVEARGGEPERVERVEHNVRRFVGATLLLLAAYVVVQSVVTLLGSEHPAESWIGIALATTSLIVMPLIAWGKLRAADEIGSSALRAEAKETLACAYLSFALLFGLLANATVGWWWADPVAAVLMVPWLTKEGREALRGEPCTCDDSPS